jgi:hypothetical protein
VVGSVPDLVLGQGLAEVQEKEAEPAGTVSRAKMRSSQFSAPSRVLGTSARGKVEWLRLVRSRSRCRNCRAARKTC